MPPWNPSQYLRFGAERTRPARDLAARIELDAPARVIDLGCGPGNSTAVLRGCWPKARVVGLDSSPAMIERARADYPAGEWVLGDAGAWNAADAFDVVFTNAALQWIPGHATLLPRLFSAVRTGGALAVGLPANDDSPLHRAVMANAADWPSLRPLPGIVYRSPAFYHGMLAPVAVRFDLWETTYWHVLPDHAALIAWYETTGLRPVLDALPDEAARVAFKAAVLADCVRAYPCEADGTVLFPFKRVFFVAYR